MNCKLLFLLHFFALVVNAQEAPLVIKNYKTAFAPDDKPKWGYYYEIQISNRDLKRITLFSNDTMSICSLKHQSILTGEDEIVSLSRANGYYKFKYRENQENAQKTRDLYKTFFDNLNISNIHLKDFATYGSTYRKDVEFSNCSFDRSSSRIGDLDFKFNKFQKNVTFYHCAFQTDVNFSKCEFNGETTFNGVSFKQGADFFLAEFKNPKTNFFDSFFHGSADFSGAVFSNGKLFSFTRLPEHLNFDGVKFNFPESEYFDFRNALLDTTKNYKCQISLSNTDVSRIILPYNLFTLNVGKYNEEFSTIYEALIKNCKDNGMLESAQNWDIEYKSLKTNINYPVLGSTFNSINKYWWNFGYAQRFILWGWLPGFFLLFFIYNTIRIERIKRIYRDDDLGKNFGLSPEFKERWHRITYSFFITAIIYFGLKIKHESVNYHDTRGVFYLYFMYLVGSIHLAFGLSYILNILN